jgi:hypothetical protein
VVVSTPPSAGRLLVVLSLSTGGCTATVATVGGLLPTLPGTSHVHSLIALPPAASKLPVLFVVTHTLCTPYVSSPIGTREQQDRQGAV